MCRRQTLTTLSPAERSVAEQHYRLVEWYVRHRGLPVDEYLDVAVFGYLLAVKRWFARPDLYRYEFTTIACAAMRSAIGNEQRTHCLPDLCVAIHTHCLPVSKTTETALVPLWKIN